MSPRFEQDKRFSRWLNGVRWHARSAISSHQNQSGTSNMVNLSPVTLNSSEPFPDAGIGKSIHRFQPPPNVLVDSPNHFQQLGSSAYSNQYSFPPSCVESVRSSTAVGHDQLPPELLNHTNQSVLKNNHTFSPGSPSNLSFSQSEISSIHLATSLDQHGHVNQDTMLNAVHLHSTISGSTNSGTCFSQDPPQRSTQASVLNSPQSDLDLIPPTYIPAVSASPNHQHWHQYTSARGTGNCYGRRFFNPLGSSSRTSGTGVSKHTRLTTDGRQKMKLAPNEHEGSSTQQIDIQLSPQSTTTEDSYSTHLKKKKTETAPFTPSPLSTQAPILSIESYPGNSVYETANSSTIPKPGGPTHRFTDSQSSDDPFKTDDDVGSSSIEEAEFNSLQQLQAFVQSLNVDCSQCARKIDLVMEDMPKMTQSWINGAGKIICGLKCHGNSCTTRTCPGCGDIIYVDESSPAMLTKPTRVIKIGETEFSVYCCCEAGRAFAVWALACGWNLDTRRKSLTRTVVDKLKQKHGRSSSEPGGPEPTWTAEKEPFINLFRRPGVMANAKGTGYGGTDSPALLGISIPLFSSRARQHQVPFSPASNGTADGEDFAQEAYFRILAALLPTLDTLWLQSFDVKPPAHLYTALARSPLVARASGLLENDSIEDASKKYSLYGGALEFVSAMARHPTTAGIVYEERQIFTTAGSTLAASFGKHGTHKTVKDTGKSLAYLLSRLAMQSRAMIQHARRSEDEFAGETETSMLALAHRVVEISSHHHENVRTLQPQSEKSEIDQGKGKRPNSTALIDHHREHAVTEVADDEIFKGHHYKKEAIQDELKMPPRGRMKRLITEISTLQTSLPEGVFITHGSSRLDVMKVLIIGPNDTPYEYGLFEFDLYCPINYPNEPPKMCFKTTGGWRIRFNPNLYSDGKVCLSLLGTWSGEPWRPTQSTLLQVLVSIQSMILCEQPWYNEPGREFVPNQTSSIQYNNQIRGWVIQHALRPWINSIPEDMHDPKNARGVDPLWAKVVQLHLRLLGCQMMTAFETAAGLGADENLKLQAAELRKVLDQQGYVTSDARAGQLARRTLQTTATTRGGGRSGEIQTQNTFAVRAEEKDGEYSKPRSFQEWISRVLR